MSLDKLSVLPKANIVEAMYILDRFSFTDDLSIDKKFFPPDLSKEKLETRSKAFRYIYEIGTGNEADIIENLGIIDLKE